MKTLLLFLVTSVVYAQPVPNTRQSNEFPNRAYATFPEPMPIFRPNVAFYRSPNGNVMRATSDNMPVIKPDSTINYKMRVWSPQPKNKYEILIPPVDLQKLMPRIVPKKDK